MITLDAILWWTIKGSLIASIALVATLLLRRQPAAVRHAVWAVALVAQLALPLSGSFAAPASLIVEIPTSSILVPSVPARVPGEPVPQSQTQRSADAPASKVSMQRIVTILFLSGVAILLLRLAAGTLRVILIARHSERVLDGEWLALVQRHCRTLEIRRPVTLISSSRMHLPVTWGFIYPIILLPEAAKDWPMELRRHVLLHELAHVRRADALTQLAAQFAVCLFWFNPLVWLAAKRLREEAENACDDYVLRDGERPSSYATTLVELVRAHHGMEPPAFASLSVGRRSELEHRVSAITRPGRAYARRGAVLATAVLAMLILVLPLSAVQRVTRELASTSEPRAKVASSERIQCRPIAGPDFEFSEMSGQFTADDGTTTHYFFVRPSPDRCLEASFSLNTRFTDDDRDVVPVRGLSAVVHETHGTVDRAVTIVEKDGALERTYSVDGRPAVWDGPARSWYESLMPEIIRRTSAGVEARAQRIVEEVGVDGLMEELKEIPPETSVRREYLFAVLELRPAGELPRAQLIEHAAALLSAFEPEMARFLAELAKREGSDPAVRADILQATGKLRDIADRKTVLDALAGHRDPAVRIAALDALPLLPSDIWRRTFLEAAAPLYLGAGDALTDAFLEAAATIERREERDALAQALLRYDPSPALRSRLEEWQLPDSPSPGTPVEPSDPLEPRR